MKKIIIILFIVAAIGGLAYLVWWLNKKYGKPKAEENTSGGSSSGSTSSSSPSANSFGSLPNGSFPIAQGQKSKKVYLLQEALNQFGGSLTIDGDFGPKTLAELNKQYNVNQVSTQLANQMKTKLIDLNKAKSNSALTTLISRFTTLMAA